MRKSIFPLKIYNVTYLFEVEFLTAIAFEIVFIPINKFLNHEKYETFLLIYTKLNATNEKEPPLFVFVCYFSVIYSLLFCLICERNDIVSGSDSTKERMHFNKMCPCT